MVKEMEKEKNNFLNTFFLNTFFQREGNSLLFEGEYLDGKRWNGKGYQIRQGFNCFDFEIKDGKGKGKEYQNYDSNKLRFKGEYINGERNGKGKEYAEVFDPTISNFSGRYFLSFEGEYLNGKRNGKGKQYYDNGELLFEGEYLNGKRNGIGKEYKNGKLEFEGEFYSGKRWNVNK